MLHGLRRYPAGSRLTGRRVVAFVLHHFRNVHVNNVSVALTNLQRDVFGHRGPVQVGLSGTITVVQSRHRGPQGKSVAAELLEKTNLPTGGSDRHLIVVGHTAIDEIE